MKRQPNSWDCPNGCHGGGEERIRLATSNVRAEKRIKTLLGINPSSHEAGSEFDHSRRSCIQQATLMFTFGLLMVGTRNASFDLLGGRYRSGDVLLVLVLCCHLSRVGPSGGGIHKVRTTCHEAAGTAAAISPNGGGTMRSGPCLWASSSFPGCKA